MKAFQPTEQDRFLKKATDMSTPSAGVGQQMEGILLCDPSPDQIKEALIAHIDRVNLSSMPSHYFRLLTADDEARFRELLRSVYGESYSYTDLYQEGRLSTQLESGSLLCIGEFDLFDHLVGHSALILKGPSARFVESGISFRRPGYRGAAREIQFQFWKGVLALLTLHFEYVHQNTSTYHPFAQKYADEYLGAKPTGLIIEFSRGERLSAIRHSDQPMHALVMSTILEPLPGAGSECFLPEGEFGNWIAEIVFRLKLNRRICRVQNAISDRVLLPSLTLVRFELNQSLSMERRRVGGQGSDRLDKREGRTDLVHLPINDGELVSLASGHLLRHGYVPVGLRPGGREPDEIVFQHLPNREAALNSLAQGTRIIGSDAIRMVEKWKKICHQLS
jgi:hypothetical protein